MIFCLNEYCYCCIGARVMQHVVEIKVVATLTKNAEMAQ